MTPIATPVIEITDLVLTPPGTGRRYEARRLVVDAGSVIAVISDIAVDVRPLLRMLATLERPTAGGYRFAGSTLDLEDYRTSLSVKRRIGYVAADAAMISNLTLRENLLLSRYYFENDLTLDIGDTVAALCQDAGLSRKLEQRPSMLNDAELLKAITIREMAKLPLLMLVDRPENFMDITETDAIFSHLKNMYCQEQRWYFFRIINRWSILPPGS